MTMPDRRLKDDIETLIERARPDQLARLLADIRKADTQPLPEPTHKATKRLQ